MNRAPTAPISGCGDGGFFMLIVGASWRNAVLRHKIHPADSKGSGLELGSSGQIVLLELARGDGHGCLHGGLVETYP